MKGPLLTSLFAAVLLSGCGFVHDEQLAGPYHLIAVDTLDQMSVSYRLASGDAVGRITETVFSVGWNDRYIVAKQHPKNDRNITHFYYLDISRDSMYGDPATSVTGPLSESEFFRRRAELGLPAFCRTIKSLQWTSRRITGTNAGGPRHLPIRTRWAARVAQFWRWAK